MSERCRTYWGSHGCSLERGHDGPCRCDCADDPDVEQLARQIHEVSLLHHPRNAGWDDVSDDLRERQRDIARERLGIVGAPPYYGPDTRFWGEDAEARGLLLVDPY